MNETPRTCEMCNTIATTAIVLPHTTIPFCKDCKTKLTSTLTTSIEAVIPTVAQATREKAVDVPARDAAEERCDFCNRIQFTEDITFFLLDKVFGLCEDCARFTELVITNTIRVLKLAERGNHA